MSNSEKYIPKVGEAFEFRCTDNDSWEKGGEILAKTEKALAYPSGTGFINVLNIQHCQFRPIPTKADIEREQLISIIKSNRYMQARFMAPEIQNAGFTIPKKVKRSEIRARLCESLESLHYISVETATDEVVNLLGDLVEDKE